MSPIRLCSRDWILLYIFWVFFSDELNSFPPSFLCWQISLLTLGLINLSMNLVVCPPLWCSYTQWKGIGNPAKRTLWILIWKPTEEWTTWIDSLLSLLPCKRYNKACNFFSNSKLCTITKAYLMLFFSQPQPYTFFNFPFSPSMYFCGHCH